MSQEYPELASHNNKLQDIKWNKFKNTEIMMIRKSDKNRKQVEPNY